MPKIPLWKRIFDIIFASLAIFFLFPLLLFTAIAIRLESKGPIIYRAKRVGQNYYIFDFLKFRSMYMDADKRLGDLEHLNQYAIEEGEKEMNIQNQDLDLVDDEIDFERLDEKHVLFSDHALVDEKEFLQGQLKEHEKTFVKIVNDPRVTNVGRFIRKYSIDELPQLFNILKGDMSVVGNRPLPLYEAELLTSDDYIERFTAPAGLTGLWQVEKRGDNGTMSPEERKDLDIQYARKVSFKLDLKIIIRTFTSFIQKEDV